MKKRILTFLLIFSCVLPFFGRAAETNTVQLTEAQYQTLQEVNQSLQLLGETFNTDMGLMLGFSIDYIASLTELIESSITYDELNHHVFNYPSFIHVYTNFQFTALNNLQSQLTNINSTNVTYYTTAVNQLTQLNNKVIELSTTLNKLSADSDGILQQLLYFYYFLQDIGTDLNYLRQFFTSNNTYTSLEQLLKYLMTNTTYRVQVMNSLNSSQTASGTAEQLLWTNSASNVFSPYYTDFPFTTFNTFFSDYNRFLNESINGSITNLDYGLAVYKTFENYNLRNTFFRDVTDNYLIGTYNSSEGIFIPYTFEDGLQYFWSSYSIPAPFYAELWHRMSKGEPVTYQDITNSLNLVFSDFTIPVEQQHKVAAKLIDEAAKASSLQSSFSVPKLIIDLTGIMSNCCERMNENFANLSNSLGHAGGTLPGGGYLDSDSISNLLSKYERDDPYNSLWRSGLNQLDSNRQQALIQLIDQLNSFQYQLSSNQEKIENYFQAILSLSNTGQSTGSNFSPQQALNQINQFVQQNKVQQAPQSIVFLDFSPIQLYLQQIGNNQNIKINGYSLSSALPSVAEVSTVNSLGSTGLTASTIIGVIRNLFQLAYCLLGLFVLYRLICLTIKFGHFILNLILKACNWIAQLIK